MEGMAIKSVMHCWMAQGHIAEGGSDMVVEAHDPDSDRLWQVGWQIRNQ